MRNVASRIALGFLAGALSNLVVEGAVGALLHAAHLSAHAPWNFAPVAPLGIPAGLSLAFWAGLFGVAYALLEPRLTARLGRGAGALAYGAVVPLLVDWLVVLPLKGRGLGGGFDPASVPVDIALNVALGLGLAALYWAGLGLAPRRQPSRTLAR
ncbi:hypothetical protein [Salinarimonas soli]|uniref:Uncharacterized protein n=1 Tax=Salinarimonas soli TaxID=1638099 RepID=A0A5B2VIC7_9HYPH|nr:hypothetical protein [Salinarimonas soli]KAA2238260.1 hypothetical protein F0L46_06335 [Salinarimonas soli]